MIKDCLNMIRAGLAWLKLSYPAVLLWLMSAAGLGVWLALEMHLLMPWSRAAVGEPGWSWVWFSPSRMPWLSALTQPLVYGGLLLLAAHVLSTHVGLLSERLKLGIDLKFGMRNEPRNVQLPGLFLFGVWWIAFALQFGSGWSCGVLMWAALLCMGRMAALALLWQVCNMNAVICPLLGYLKPYAKVVVGGFAALLFCVMLGNFNTELLGDEPSYVYSAASLVHNGSTMPDAALTAQLDQMFGMEHRFDVVTRPDTQTPVAKHFVGPSVFLLPAWLLAMAGVPAAWAVRGWMMLAFAFWIFGAYWLSFKITGRTMASVLATVIVALSFPMMGLSGCVYPDNLVGYIMLGALLIGNRVFAEPGTRLTSRQVLAILALACLIPWMHVKYGFLSVVLGVFVILYRPRVVTPRLLTGAIALVAVGVALFAAYYLTVYGLFLPGNPDGPIVRNGYFGMLFDLDSGMLIYSPWILLLPIGAVVLSQRIENRAFSTMWCVLAAVVYLTTASAPFWGSAGSPALRYLSPVLALCTPLLAAAILHFMRRSYVLALLFLIPLVLLPAHIDDMYRIYGPETQKGRSLFDAAITGFSIQEFMQYFDFSWRKLNVPHGLAHSVLMLVCFGIFLGGLIRRGRDLRGAKVMVLSLPMLLALSAWVTGSPTWTMNDTKIFTEQIRRVNEVESWRKSQLVRLLGKKDKSEIVGIPRTVLRLPLTLKPFGVSAHSRLMGLTPDNGLALDWRPIRYTFAFAVLPDMSKGYYRMSLYGRPKNAEPTTGVLEMKIRQYDDSPILGEFFTRKIPGAQGDAPQQLLTGTVHVPADKCEPWTLHVLLSCANATPVVADALEIEYLGLRAPAGFKPYEDTTTSASVAADEAVETDTR